MIDDGFIRVQLYNGIYFCIHVIERGVILRSASRSLMSAAAKQDLSYVYELQTGTPKEELPSNSYRFLQLPSIWLENVGTWPHDMLVIEEQRHAMALVVAADCC